MKKYYIIIAITSLVVFSYLLVKSTLLNTIYDHLDNWPPELIEKVVQNRIDRDMVQLKYPKLFPAVSEVLFRHDLIGINFGTNIDEYEAEAGTIIPGLTYCYSAEDTVNLVHKEFVKWFGPETAGTRDQYIEVGNEIWSLWLELGPKKLKRK